MTHACPLLLTACREEEDCYLPFQCVEDLIRLSIPPGFTFDDELVFLMQEISAEFIQFFFDECDLGLDPTMFRLCQLYVHALTAPVAHVVHLLHRSLLHFDRAADFTERRAGACMSGEDVICAFRHLGHPGYSKALLPYLRDYQAAVKAESEAQKAKRQRKATAEAAADRVRAAAAAAGSAAGRVPHTATVERVAAEAAAAVLRSGGGTVAVEEQEQPLPEDGTPADGVHPMRMSAYSYPPSP